MSNGMTDTPPEIERMVRQWIMNRSGEERFIMGAEMFDAAVTMIRASFPLGLSVVEEKRRLYMRLYGDLVKKSDGGLPDGADFIKD